MNYWLIKSDPETYGWDDLVKEKKTCWSGVRNYAARNHLKAMKKNDLVLFYHSNEQQVIGIAKVEKEFYPDPTTKETAWVAVDVSPVKKLNKTVLLEEVKTDKRLAQIPLVRIARLSVMPLKQEEYDAIIEISGK